MNKSKNRKLLLSAIIAVLICVAFFVQILSLTVVSYCVKGNRTVYCQYDYIRSQYAGINNGFRDNGGINILNVNGQFIVFSSGKQSFVKPVLDSFLAILFKIALFPTLIILLCIEILRHWKSVQQIIVEFIQKTDGKKRKPALLLI
jgi:hypothetical protein